MSLITCKQFFDGQKPDATAVILGWLHGYYRDDKDPPHSFSRASIEKAIAETGFQLWRLKQTPAA